MSEPWQRSARVRWREYEKREALRAALNEWPAPSIVTLAAVRSALQAQRWNWVTRRRAP